MNITIIAIGKIKEKYLLDAMAEYSKRLSRFVKLNIVELADEKIPDKANEKEIQQIKDIEGCKIISQIKQGSYIVTLCIEGKQLSSEELANKFLDISMINSHITFIIGGSLGLSDQVKQLSNLQLSFSKMTLPHQLMRVFLVEQIYRAYKINSNESYHK